MEPLATMDSAAVPLIFAHPHEQAPPRLVGTHLEWDLVQLLQLMLLEGNRLSLHLHSSLKASFLSDPGEQRNLLLEHILISLWTWCSEGTGQPSLGVTQGFVP